MDTRLESNLRKYLVSLGRHDKREVIIAIIGGFLVISLMLLINLLTQPYIDKYVINSSVTKEELYYSSSFPFLALVVFYFSFLWFFYMRYRQSITLSSSKLSSRKPHNFSTSVFVLLPFCLAFILSALRTVGVRYEPLSDYWKQFILYLVFIGFLNISFEKATRCYYMILRQEHLMYSITEIVSFLEKEVGHRLVVSVPILLLILLAIGGHAKTWFILSAILTAVSFWNILRAYKLSILVLDNDKEGKENQRQKDN